LRNLILASKPFWSQLDSYNELLKFNEKNDIDIGAIQEQAEISSKSIETLNAKIKNLESTIKILNHNKLTTENEFDKQKGLLAQKIENLETCLSDSKTRESSLTCELKEQRQGLMKKMKDKETENDTRYQEIKEKFEISQDLITDLEAKVEEFRQVNEWEKLKQHEIKVQLDVLSGQKDETIESLSLKIVDLKNQSTPNVDQQDNDELQGMKDEIEQLNTDLQDCQHESKTLKTQLEKADAIHAQKLSFYETQLSEAKSQQEDSQKSHESLMSAFKNLEAENENSNVHELIQQQKSEQLEEFKIIEAKHAQLKQDLTSQLEILTDKNNKLELDMKIQVTDLLKENHQLSEQTDDLKSQKQQLSDSLKQLEDEKLKLVDSIEDHYKAKIDKLEDQINDKKKNGQDSLEEIANENQKQLDQLKEFYEQEKQRLEARIEQEKTASKRKLEQQKEEFEDQQREDEEMHEEDTYRQLEQERTAYMQKIEYLESVIEEWRKSGLNALEKQLDRFSKERKNLKDALEKEYQNKRADLDSEKQGLLDKITKLNSEVDQLHESLQNLKDENIKQKLNYTREEAIINQKCEFKEEKIQELLKLTLDQQQQNEEKWNALRQETSAENNDRINKLELENERLSERYETKRKAAKDLENELNKFRAEKDRESIILEQKVNSLESCNKKMLDKHTNEFGQLKEEYVTKNNSLELEIQVFDRENTDLKTRILDAERDISEITSNYERDKALWEDKFDFLENQKQQAKHDLQDAHRKFEMTVEQLRRKDNSERGKTESAQMLLISSIEKKYKDQIKDMTDSHTQIVQDLSMKLKKLEKEYRDLKERYELETRGNVSEFNNMEKKLREVMDSEQMLIDEMRDLKNERDRKSLEHQAIVEREKEIYKQRLYEAETKSKSSEGKRSTMMFEFEKERARWTLDKDKLVTDIESMTDSLKKAKRKRDAALKDNDKIKNEFKSRARYAHSSTLVPNVGNGLPTTRKFDLNKDEFVKAPITGYGKCPTMATKYIGDFSTHKSSSKKI
jgi:chromosome segregation ATPase